MLEPSVLATATEGEEPVAAAVAGVRRRLFRKSHTDQVAADLIEDDLREAVGAFSEVGSFLSDLLDALAGNASAADLVAAGDDGAIQDQLEYLSRIVRSLRRRIALLAARRPPGRFE